MTNRVVLGPLPGGGSGVRVSRPGHDVLSTGLTPKQVSFDSRWASGMRVAISALGSGTGTIGYGTTYADFPMVIQVMTDAQGRYQTMNSSSTTGGGPGSPGYVYPRIFKDSFMPSHPFTGWGTSFSYYVLLP